MLIGEYTGPIVEGGIIGDFKGFDFHLSLISASLPPFEVLARLTGWDCVCVIISPRYAQCVCVSGCTVCICNSRRLIYYSPAAHTFAPLLNVAL